jgi:hypothetical protein
MPEGPAVGRVEAKRRALTTPSTAPPSNGRWCDAWIWIRKRDVPAGKHATRANRFRFYPSAALFRRISIRRRARGRRIRLHDTGAGTPTCGTTDDGVDDSVRRLGPLARQDTGVVHAIVGSPTAIATPTVTAAKSAASIAPPQQGAAIQTLARSERSWSNQG